MLSDHGDLNMGVWEADADNGFLSYQKMKYV